jgi:lipopolysaccharide export system permease protein
MPSLLDRLVWEEVEASFGFALGFFTILLVMNTLFSLVRQVIAEGLAIGTALLLMLYKIPDIIAFCVPFGVLLATVLGISRLGDHNEITALRVSGVSLYRIAAPVIAGGALAALATLVFSEGVVSLSDHQYRVVAADAASHGPVLRPIQNIFFQAPVPPHGSALYHADSYDPRSRTLSGMTIVYLAAGQPVELIVADSARYTRGEEWAFHEGHTYLFSQGNVVATRFAALDVRVPRSPLEFSLPPLAPLEMNLRELAREITSLRLQGADPRRYVFALQAKVAAAVSCIIFALIAFPLSLRPHRSGPGMGIGLSFIVLVAYFLIYIPAQTVSEGPLLSPVLAAWLPNLVVGCAGAVLLARAAR